MSSENDTATQAPEKVVNDAVTKQPVEPVLVPAPLPTQSPWKSAPAASNFPTISVEQLDLSSNKKKNHSTTIKSSASTKWLPMKASIVVAKSTKSNDGKKTSTRNAKTKNQNHSGNNRSTRKGGPKQTDVTSSETKAENNSSTRNSSRVTPSAGTPQLATDEQKQQKHPKRHMNSNNDHTHHPRHYHQHQHNGLHRKRYHNNLQHARAAGNSHHIYRNSSMYYNPMYQQQILMAVNNVARQIEYYFSTENLSKDDYLRSKLSKTGYVPVSLVAKFYRMVNLSFGGDRSIIMGALREIVANGDATVDIANGSLDKSVPAGEYNSEDILNQYFVRAKDWQKWVVADVNTIEHKTEEYLTGNSLDQFMVIALPPLNQTEKQGIAFQQELQQVQTEVS